MAGLALALVPAVAAAAYVVDYPWVRPAGKGGATEVFMELTSIDGGALVGARSEIAGRVVIVGPGARNKSVARLPLPAGAPIILAPGSYRLRLSPLDRALKRGDILPLVLIVETADGRREEISVTAEALPRSQLDLHLQPHPH